MARTTASDRRDESQRSVVALLTELMNPPDPQSKGAVEEHAVTVDGLADDILESDAEGALLFLADLAARAVKSLSDKTGTAPAACLQSLASPATGQP
jgi:hypothetical protein